MNYWNKICGFGTIFFLSALFSSAQKLNNIRYEPSSLFASRLLPGNTFPLFSLKEDTTLLKSKAPAPITIISQNYYTQHFGFFCKKELALEKATKIPLRFRLGSLQHCNYLEGK
jgi:hypothetical protein